MRIPFLVLWLVSSAACKTATEPSSPPDDAGPPPSSGEQSASLLGEIPDSSLYPPGNWWRLDVSSAPLDPDSSRFIDFLGDARLHPDFGPPPFGIPYVTVSANQPLVPVTFVAFPAESDLGAPGRPGYPIPDAARTEPNYIEGAAPGGGDNGDRHLLIFDRDRRLLFETWATRFDEGRSRWEAGSGAVFDLATGARRPEGLTSADAAGLAILPGLVRFDEVSAPGDIPHGFRVTVRATNGHVWPASHTAGSTPGAPPMGARLRLKASVDLSAHPEPVRKIFVAMKRYGLIVADNGSDLFVTGTMDPRWSNDVLNPAFRSLRARDFEVIELGWR